MPPPSPVVQNAFLRTESADGGEPQTAASAGETVSLGGHGGYNEGAIVKQVINGKGAMPAFGGRLSDDDIANVAAFVISTSKAGWE